MNVISSRIGLRRYLLPKPTVALHDLLYFLVTYIVHCDSVFANKKQRLYILTGLNLSSISAYRAVLLFDIRHPIHL
jgi:hypothetical protein